MVRSMSQSLDNSEPDDTFRGVRSKLDAAIEEFFPYARDKGWDTAEGAENFCNTASNAFLFTLEEHGLVGEIEHYERDVILDRVEYPYGDLRACYYHWAVRVGDTIIDWTARQFDELAPFPAVWQAERRAWRNVSEEAGVMDAILATTGLNG